MNKQPKNVVSLHRQPMKVLREPRRRHLLRPRAVTIDDRRRSSIKTQKGALSGSWQSNKLSFKTYRTMINYSIVKRSVNANLIEINQAKSRINQAKKEGKTPQPADIPAILYLTVDCMREQLLEGKKSSTPYLKGQKLLGGCVIKSVYILRSLWHILFILVISHFRLWKPSLTDRNKRA